MRGFEIWNKFVIFARQTKHRLMKKCFLPAIILALFAIVACNQGAKSSSANVKSDTTRLAVLTFEKQADSCINKPVMIEGTVFHTCKEGGKRMFLVDGTDSIRVQVTAGGNIVKFDESLTGSRVRVFGTLKEERIDAKYLNEWEAEVRKPDPSHAIGVHSGAVGHEDQDTKDKLENINSLRDDLKKSGKDHLSFFSIEAVKFIELK